MTFCRLFCVALERLAVGNPNTEPFVAVVSEGSRLEEVSRESRDFDGRVDCENGVVVEVRLADVFAEPLADG